MKIFKKIIPIIALLAAALTVVVYLRGRSPGGPLDSLTATGTIEATEVALSPKIAETIDWLCCRVGERVRAGQAVARLDARELKALVAEARATVTASAEAVKEARVELEIRRVAVDSAGYAVETARSEVIRVKSLAIDAEKEFKRLSALVKKGFVSKSAFDRAKASYDSATASLNSAKSKLNSEKAALRNARVAVKRAEAAVSAVKARRLKDEATVAVLETRLSYAVLKSPINGVVSYKAFEAGEMTSPGTAIYTIYDLKDIWARIDVGESELGRVRLGAEAEVWTEANPTRVFKAVVSEIGQMGEFATHKDVVRVSHDIKTFRVKVKLLSSTGFLKPGMTCKVRIPFDVNKKKNTPALRE